jgi:hypothetical protein
LGFDHAPADGKVPPSVVFEANVESVEGRQCREGENDDGMPDLERAHGVEV